MLASLVEVTVPTPDPDLVTVKFSCGAGANVAVTLLAAVPIVTEHVDVPVQSPVHPAKVEPAAGNAVRTTVDPVLIVAEQAPGQLIPPTLLVTEPVPVPAKVTLTGNDVGMKLALTDCAELMVTVHASAPLQAPPHPLNTAPDCAVGVSVTTVPLSKSKAHVVPQEIPLGLLVIEPDPVTEVFSVNLGNGAGPKVAVTVWLDPNVNTQPAVPLHPPLQPLNTDPEAGVAASEITVPETNVVEHVVPQLIPVGTLDTAPVPVPARVTPNV
jgi:hypothetical protein